MESWAILCFLFFLNCEFCYLVSRLLWLFERNSSFLSTRKYLHAKSKVEPQSVSQPQLQLQFHCSQWLSFFVFLLNFIVGSKALIIVQLHRNIEQQVALRKQNNKTTTDCLSSTCCYCYCYCYSYYFRRRRAAACLLCRQPSQLEILHSKISTKR